MAKVLDNFMINIAGRFDGGGFKQATTAFAGLKSRGLMLGAGLAAAGFAAKKAVDGIMALNSQVAMTHDLVNKDAFVLDMDPTKLQVMESAMMHFGAAAGETTAFLKQMQQTLADTEMNHALQQDLLKASFGKMDISFVNEKDDIKRFQKFIKAREKLDKKSRLRVDAIMGVSGGLQVAAEKGSSAVNQQLEDSSRFVQRPKEIYDRSSALKDAEKDFDDAVESGLAHLSNMMMPLQTSMNQFGADLIMGAISLPETVNAAFETASEEVSGAITTLVGGYDDLIKKIDSHENIGEALAEYFNFDDIFSIQAVKESELGEGLKDVLITAGTVYEDVASSVKEIWDSFPDLPSLNFFGDDDDTPAVSDIEGRKAKIRNNLLQSPSQNNAQGNAAKSGRKAVGAVSTNANINININGSNSDPNELAKQVSVRVRDEVRKINTEQATMAYADFAGVSQ